MYAVANINFSDNELIIELHEANSPVVAFLKHSITFFDEAGLLEALDTEKTIDEIDMKDVKQIIFDCDGMTDVKEVPITK